MAVDWVDRMVGQMYDCWAEKMTVVTVRSKVRKMAVNWVG